MSSSICRGLLHLPDNDSGGMHIASALASPTVAVFGATDDVGNRTHGTARHAKCVSPSNAARAYFVNARLTIAA